MAKPNPGALVAAAQGHAFTKDQVDLIKRTIANGATDDELKLFLYTCEKRRLDPLARQIYFQKRRRKNGPDQMTILTSIDGYRLIANRTGLYAGNDDPIFDNEDNPSKATATVYKIVGGLRCAFTAMARWEQYYPGDDQGFMWRKMPHLMLGKCAEGLALRKAFPEELGGLYIEEEMHQAGPALQFEAPPVISTSTTPVVLDVYDGETRALKNELLTIAKKHGITAVPDLQVLNHECKGVPMRDLEAAVKEWKEREQK